MEERQIIIGASDEDIEVEVEPGCEIKYCIIAQRSPASRILKVKGKASVFPRGDPKVIEPEDHIYGGS